MHRTLPDIIAIMFAILFKRQKQKPNHLNKKKRRRVISSTPLP
jgi:hypothetical protein